MHIAPSRPPAIGLIALFLKFLRFGCLAFGGPVAQIAMLRQALVEEEGWIDRGRFHRLLAVLQILPGPEAHELCVHFGVLARGRIGGLLAGLGFMLPGFCLMLLVGWLYVSVVQGSVGFGGILLGIQVAILAVILRAVVRIGQHVIEDRLLAAIAVAAAVATLIGVPFWIPLLVGGGVYATMAWPAMMVAIGVAGIVTAIGAMSVAAPAQAGSMAQPLTILALFLAGLKGGLLTFGGAYTAIPYVRADTVGRGWIGDAAFLDGVAFANVIPAPLVIFATFVGFVAGSLTGALAITLGMFLPAFAFSLLFFERLERIVDAPSLRHALTGVAAAVVGIIAATFVQLAMATGGRVDAGAAGLALFVVALAMAWRLKGGWVTPLIVAVGAMVGWAFF
ncbi:chromate transporter [Sphingomonas sp. Leaf24]|uniref:chromate efflux transporter n=1 Tax=unclassified Sphingomonas TaxID=196159 RepID=UPI0006FB8623|nr:MULTISPECIES: chromate efflux transporter [unclassified Sphingomonas]KQM17162.1 chromate transporter [Sphingomonas sp. Leaf5]KQM88055.1 chromate transporter [Sphingomonas sp. Leaf24]